MVERGTARVKRGLAEMLKGGVIMDVTTAGEARIAEEAGAVAVMALERVPADIRRDGGVARMADPHKVAMIMEAVTIPVMAKARIGHIAEAQILQSMGVDYIDESEVLTPADESFHIDKWNFTVPFVCGATNLGEALRRIGEGAAMIRSKGEAGTGNVVEAVKHLREIFGHIRRLQALGSEELMHETKITGAPHELIKEVAEVGRLPVVVFCAGGIATPADAALVMQLGAEGVFVGSGIFKSEAPARTARAIVEATTYFNDPDVLAKVSKGLGEAMGGLDLSRYSTRPAVVRAGMVGGVDSARAPYDQRAGVLSLQGDFQAHLDVLSALGYPNMAVRSRQDLEAVDCLIMPGGESTTILKLIDRYELRDLLVKRVEQGMAVFATCAGAIVLAEKVNDGEAPLGLLPIEVERNAYGRQVDSFETDIQIPVLGTKVRAVFIRAPKISGVGEGVQVLASWADAPVLVRSERILAATFHPELAGETRIHKYFIEQVAAGSAPTAPEPSTHAPQKYRQSYRAPH